MEPRGRHSKVTAPRMSSIKQGLEQASMIEREALNCHRAGRSGRARGWPAPGAASCWHEPACCSWRRHWCSRCSRPQALRRRSPILFGELLGRADGNEAGRTGALWRWIMPRERCSWAMRAMKWSMCTAWPARIRRSLGAKVKRRSNRWVWRWMKRMAMCMWRTLAEHVVLAYCAGWEVVATACCRGGLGLGLRAGRLVE